MTDIVIRTGSQGDVSRIGLEWFDENNIRHVTEIRVEVSAQDQPRSLKNPRILSVYLGGQLLALIDGNNVFIKSMEDNDIAKYAKERLGLK